MFLVVDLVFVRIMYRVSQKKTHFQNATGATVHWLNHILLAPLLCLEIDFFGRFSPGDQVMSMVKFSPIALKFGYDFVL